jgi:surfactin synthase thioesterase subunit
VTASRARAAVGPRSVTRLDDNLAAVADVVVFPGAGHAVARFRPFAAHLGGHLGLVGVERAGRGTRLGERADTSLAAVAAEAVDGIRTVSDRPVVLMGHSAGSLIAHAAAHLLAAADVEVLGIVALNGRSPTVTEHISWLDATDEDIAADLVGIRPELAPLFERADMAELFMPGLRADLELYRRNGDECFGPVDVAVVAVGARSDSLVPAPHIWAWRSATRSRFVAAMIDGDHFGVVDDPARHVPAVAELIDMYLLDNTRPPGG